LVLAFSAAAGSVANLSSIRPKLVMNYRRKQWHDSPISHNILIALLSLSLALNVFMLIYRCPEPLALGLALATDKPLALALATDKPLALAKGKPLALAIDKPLSAVIPKANTRLLDWYKHNSQLFGGSAKEWSWLTGEMIGSDSIMLNIGANVGIYAHCLLRTFPQVHVISFEPIEQYADFIRNHPLSNTQRLTVEALAMGHKQAPTNLTLLMDKSNLGWNTLHTSAAVIKCAECMEATQITLVAFDYYYSLRPELSSKKICFIKIDTEGY
jgi:FkbM family methyltransferase